MTTDDIVRTEESKIERFMALGLGRYAAIGMVEDGVDWHTVEALVKTGRPLAVALEASRGGSSPR